MLTGFDSTTHPAFNTWAKYSYYFKQIKKHGVQGAEYDKGTYYFINKKGQRCKL